VAPNGGVKGLEQERLLLLTIRLAGSRITPAVDVPVFGHAQGPAPKAEGLPRQELPDALEDAPGGGDVVEREVKPEGLPVDPPLHAGVLQDRPDLRGEEQRAAVVPVDEGLDADAVAAQHERPRPFVPEGEGEHAREPPRAGFPLFLVEMDDDLAVGMRAEAVAPVLHLPAELGVVVDLAVEDEPHGAVFVGKRLAAGLGQIDDGEPAMPKPHGRPGARAQVQAGPVGAPVGHDVRHAPQDRLVDPAAVCRDDSADPAHTLQPVFPAFRAVTSREGPQRSRPALRRSADFAPHHTARRNACRTFVRPVCRRYPLNPERPALRISIRENPRSERTLVSQAADRT